MLLLGILTGLVGLSRAYSDFNSICSLPTHTVNYVSSSNTRGSLDIVWSCFGTLIACVYWILHFNIPPSKEHVSKRRGEFLGGDWLRTYEPMALLAFWSCFTVLVPELIYCTSIVEWFNARSQLQKLRKELERKGGRFEEEAECWKKTHMFFANMGGFVLLYRYEVAGPGDENEFSDQLEPGTEYAVSRHQSVAVPGSRSNSVALPSANVVQTGSEDENPEKHEEAIGSEDTEQPHRQSSSATSNTEQSEDAPETGQGAAGQIEYANRRVSQALDYVPEIKFKRRFKSRGPDRTNTLQSVQSIQSALNPTAHHLRKYHLNAKLLIAAIQAGLVSHKAVPEDEIEDRSKSDWLAKLLVVFQLCQFFVGVLARLVEHLPVTPLEVAVSAFAVCSLGAYFFLFSKPKNARTTVPLRIYNTKKDIEKDLETLDLSDRPSGGQPPPPIELRLRRENMLDNRDIYRYMWAALLCCGSTIFGGIHLAGWNLDFPSYPDMWLWRSCAIATAAIPMIIPLEIGIGVVLVVMPISWVRNKFEIKVNEAVVKVAKNFWYGLMATLLYVLTIAYALARLVILVEMFRTLFYLPPKAYLTPSWSLNIPHIG